VKRTTPQPPERNTVPRDRPWFKHWPDQVPKHIDYPRKPLPYLLQISADRFGQKVAFRSGETSITFKELSEATDKFAGGLRSAGIRRGDRVLLLLPNSIPFVMSFFGTVKAGCAAVTLNHLSRESEISRAVIDTEPKAAVVTGSLDGPELDTLESSGLKIIEVCKTPRDAFESFRELLDSSPSQSSAEAEWGAPAVIQYTGATTGSPKPVIMSNRNLLANAIQNATWFSWDERDVVAGLLPLCHTWGCSCCMNSPIYAGATTILVDRFDPEKLLEKIESERVTVLYGSATMFSMLLAYPNLEEYDISSLRWAKAGAMPVPLELKRRWDRRTGIEMTLGYGLTEASPETHDSPPGNTREGTIGIPIIDTDARVVDIDSGADVDAGRPGELLIRGPQVSSFGYLGDDEETERAFREGWLHTGDIAVMDSDGFFRLVDRKKDIIKYKGYTIYPVELENVLYEHPGVKECAVVGIKHPEYGEVPKAFIVCQDEASVAREAVISFTEKRLTPYKKIRQVEFVRELPKTHVGKVMRRRLRGEV
jgi:long-chain acyl-CoA synthetase